MPSRTLPPDLRPAPAPPAPPGTAAPPAPPGTAAPPGTTVAPYLPGLRLVTVPDAAPPYDCEAHGAACPERRDLAGAEPRNNGQPPEPGGARSTSMDRGPEPVSPGRTAAPGSESATPAANSSAAPAASSAVAATSGWPRQFAQVVVEILGGTRSPRQIVPCSTERVRQQIAFLTALVAPGQRPRIRRIMMSRPAVHAVEMTVVVSFGPRARALAMRCEHLPPRPAAPGRPGRPARWLCTELEAGLS
ncbi:MAG: Rv3235 family protein [Streptosporangiaceae bacterium]